VAFGHFTVRDLTSGHGRLLRCVKASQPAMASSEHRFRMCYGSGYIAADTKALAREIGLEPRTTPVRSPQSNGMAEAFVRTMKRDYVRVSPRPDARTVIAQISRWFEHYNTIHPHRALGYRSPHEFIADQTAT
jgi:transposase InsO family protein